MSENLSWISQLEKLVDAPIGSNVPTISKKAILKIKLIEAERDGLDSLCRRLALKVVS